MLNVGEVQAVAPKLGIELIMLELGPADDIASAIEHLKGRAQALYVVGDPFVLDNQIQINTLALVARLPTMHIRTRICRNRRSAVVRAELLRPVPPRRRLRRQDPQGR